LITVAIWQKFPYGKNNVISVKQHKKHGDKLKLISVAIWKQGERMKKVSTWQKWFSKCKAEIM